MVAAVNIWPRRRPTDFYWSRSCRTQPNWALTGRQGQSGQYCYQASAANSEENFKGIINEHFKKYHEKLFSQRVNNKLSNSARNFCKWILCRGTRQKVRKGQYPLTSIYRKFGNWGVLMTMQMHIAAKIHPEEIGPHNPVPRIEDRRPLPQKSKLATELYSGRTNQGS